MTTTITKNHEETEKNQVAFLSLMAALFLTTIKLVVGLATNSLGILSEAIHSGLDLLAAGVTLFAVRVSGQPADEQHHYGHAKVENISALFETVLLLVTCLWIMVEAFARLSGKHAEITVNFWSFAVMITSIVIDISRTVSLRRIAKKYRSQALEADALHFSSDILSSLVVLMGLIGVSFGYHQADCFAALVVAIIIILLSVQLGKRAIDELLDKAPEGTKDEIKTIVLEMVEIFKVHDIRVRNAGGQTFVDLNIHVHPGLTIEQGHEISHRVEQAICNRIARCEVHIHIEPESRH